MIAVGGRKRAFAGAGVRAKSQRLIWAFALLAPTITGVVSSLGPAPAAQAQTPPAWTSSYIMTTTDPNTLKSDGCSVGKRGVAGYHILDWGRPAYNSSTSTYGVYSTHFGFASNATVESGTEAWAEGWWGCKANNTAVIFIAMGISNQCLPDDNSGCAYPVPNGDASLAGYYWGYRVSDFDTWLANQGYGSQEGGAGGYDAEQQWDPQYASTKDFEDGYGSETSLSLADDGTAAPASAWGNSGVWHISWGEISAAIPFPEIYGEFGNPSTLISEWIGDPEYCSGSVCMDVDVWAHGQGLSYYVYGVTDDYNPSNTGCNGDYTPDQAWTQTLARIQDNTNTDYQSTIPYLTDFAC